MTESNAPMLHRDPTVPDHGDVGDWALGAGLTLLTWFTIALSMALGRRGFHVPVMPGFPEGGPPIFIIDVRGPGPDAYLLVALAFLPLGLRRRIPMTVLGIVTAANVLYELVPHPPALTIVGVIVAVYTVGTLYERARLVEASLITGAALLLSSFPAIEARFWLSQVLRTGSFIAIAAAVGDATRNRRAYVAEVEQRALEAERTREEEARRRVDEERLRIARELHDVTAHSLSVIAVQSGAAAHVIDSRPDEARRALDAIRRTSKDALQELRRMVGVLRGEDAGAAPHEPVATLAQLPALAEQFRAAGLEVSLEVTTSGPGVPPLVDSSAYRVVQESLTNALRHAGVGAHATVTIGEEVSDLVVQVTDLGSGPGEGWNEGHGIAGMRERAVALGGTFEAGPGPSGGFRVTARYPLASTGGAE